ncbi:hypothetical protein M3J09_005538 [Ascochyta lentis]
MTSFIPGSLVLYREPGSGLPLWPSIYCTFDVAPKAFLRTRPSGYVSLVLKLAGMLSTSQLRWATTTDLHHFDPFAADEETKRSSPGLADAYTVALEALESGLDLGHWKAALESQDDSAIVIDSDDDLDSDEDMRLAMEMSIADLQPQRASIMPRPAVFQAKCSNASQSSFVQAPERSRLFPSLIPDQRQPLSLRRHAQTFSRFLKPTPSPPRRTTSFALSPRLSKRPGSPSPASSDDGPPSPPRRRKLSGSGRSSTRTDSYSFSSQSSNCIPSPTLLSSEDDSLLPLPGQKKRTAAIKPKSFGRVAENEGQHRKSSLVRQDSCASEIHFGDRPNASAAAVPNEDVIEEDLEESSQFVQVFVGPKVEDDPEADPERKQHRFQLMRCHVWGRPYFRNTLSAHSYLTPVGENTWELQHPRLPDILPEDFRIVAEFLSDGDFGHRQPQDEEKVAETFAQSISAWKTADLLSMDDLLDHIVEKMRKAQPWWDMVNVMAFACIVYQSEISLQAHDEMKALLSDYIADVFYVYIGDDHLSGHFTARLQQLPELGRDVFTKMAAQSSRRLPPQEEAALQSG